LSNENKSINEDKSIKGKIQKALNVLEMEGEKLNTFLFGTPSSEMMEKGIRTLFPSFGDDIRQKTELTSRDVRACLYLKLAGKWVCKPFDAVAEEFMHLQISKGRMGRTELSTILMMANLLENLPKETVSKLFIKPQGEGVTPIAEKK
jgi:hypothetical protein